MNVKTGRAPWEPHPDATDLDVLHYHDMPLIGTFRLHGSTIAFMCLHGHTSQLNTWAYVPLTDEAVARVTAAETLPQLQAALIRHIREQGVTYGMAADGKIIGSGSTTWQEWDGWREWLASPEGLPGS